MTKKVARKTNTLYWPFYRKNVKCRKTFFFIRNIDLKLLLKQGTENSMDRTSEQRRSRKENGNRKKIYTKRQLKFFGHKEEGGLGKLNPTGHIEDKREREREGSKIFTWLMWMDGGAQTMVGEARDLAKGEKFVDSQDCLLPERA